MSWRRYFSVFKSLFRKRDVEVFPEDVLMDAHNLPEFDTHQFEGRIVSPIKKGTLLTFVSVFALVSLLYTGRLFYLQIVYGETYAVQSEDNRLRHSIIFAERGTIYDRRGEKIAWNEPPTVPGEVFRRIYRENQGSHILAGYISYPTKDNNGFYYREDFSGEEGLELIFNDKLAGDNGTTIVETDALGNVVSSGRVRPPVPGEDLHTTIDVELQEKMHKVIGNLAEEVNFRGGGGIIIDVHTGEIIASASYPEYDSNLMTNRDDSDAVTKILEDTRNPFLDRPISGVFIPGSIVKPYLALASLHENIIDPLKQIYSSGSITIPNPYNPEQSTVIRDWRAHGWTDMRRALAVSSNVYFFAVGGGLEDQEGLGISRINKYLNLFEFEELTGLNIPGEAEGNVPSPAWKEATFPQDGDWRLGDTYNTAIGQYGFAVTPLRMAVSVATIATNGKRVTPTLLKDDIKTAYDAGLPFTEREYQIVQEGMQLGVEEGTAIGLNLVDVEIAAKTGTAELGTEKNEINSWVMGYFPYDDPQYAFTLVMEHGPRSNLIGATSVMRQVMEWIIENRPEYIGKASENGPN